MKKQLKEVLHQLCIDYTLDLKDQKLEDVQIEGIAFSSQSVQSGFLFVCIAGENFDGHNFVTEAVNNGAVAVLSQKQLDNINVPLIVVEDTALAMGKFAAAFYDYPGKRLRLIGVTGTNGKTTVVHLIQKILESYNKKCGLIGTLGHRLSSSDAYVDAKHTTPQSPDLQKYLAEMLDQGFDYCSMEVSSHSLDLHRVVGCDFAIALLTNVTQDHLDFHVTMENYANAKLKLFKSLEASCAENKSSIINIDDRMAHKFISEIPEGIKILTYGIHANADVQAQEIQYLSNGTIFECVSPVGKFKINMKLKGQFSVYNALASIAIGLEEKIPIDTIVCALAEIENVPGRFESISDHPVVIVDYAHTPDGLENILETARKLVSGDGELITVFGCGGDRDPTKRPQMARIAEALSDRVVITSDNPRTEDPQQIITDTLTGIKSLNECVVVEIDRKDAIEIAINQAKENDVVVIAGKGHEDYQILGNKTIHFDDREVAKEFLEKRKVFSA